MTLKILGIETSTGRGSVALLSGGGLTSRELPLEGKNSKWILSAIDELLAGAAISKKELDIVAFGRGPGAFVGVRLAMNVVQSIAFVLNIPVIAVSSLQVIAQQALREHRISKVLVALDARMQQIYWGCYQYSARAGLMENWSEETLSDPQAVRWPSELQGPWIGIGSGWDNYKAHLVGRYIADCYPKAYDVVAIASRQYRKGNLSSALTVSPTYVRNQVAH